MTEPRQINTDLWAGQERLITDRKIAKHGCVAGNGYGKTTFGVKWSFHRVLENSKRGCQFSYVTSNTAGRLKEANMPIYDAYLQEIGLTRAKPFPDYSITWSPGALDLMFRWGHTVLMRSAAPGAVSNIVSVTASHAWADEPGLCPRQLDVELLKRVRDRRATHRQRLFTGTPEGMNWFAQEFGGLDRVGDGRFSEGDGRLVLHGRTYDNPTLPREWIDELYREFGWNENLILAYIEGEFVPIYEDRGYDFDPRIHYQEFVKPSKSKPIYLTWDFNVTQGRAAGVSWCAVQEDYADLWCVAENKGSSRTTSEAAHSFIEQFPVSQKPDTPSFEDYDQGWEDVPILLTGDCNGANRDTRTYVCDYDIIESELKAAGFNNVQTIVPAANPPVGLRIASTNRLFSSKYEKSLLLSPNCTRTGDSLLQTTIDKKGKIIKTSNDTITHQGEALGYVVVDLRPMIKPTLYGGESGFHWG